MTPRIARVVVEIALNREFDYAIPEELSKKLQVGSQVVVPFGHSETRGYIVSLAAKSRVKNLKSIVAPVGEKSLIHERVMELAHWMADYYAAPIEHAVKTVLPSAVRKKGASFKKQLAVRPTVKAIDQEALAVLEGKASRQASALDALQGKDEMLLHELCKLTGATTQVIRALEKKGFVAIESQSVDRDPHKGHEILTSQPLDLMPQQEEALQAVKKSMETFNPSVILLHGVTGSGKTEIYLQAISHALTQKKGAIVLVPEISLTPQTVERFRSRFGDIVAVLHSNLSEGERHDEWHRLRDGKAIVAIGARSALFAPVNPLGLIIVDEEHEHSYKQDEAPRYNARDVAVVRGKLEKCPVVLGSATPSIESYHNVQCGKYSLVQMPHRVDHQKMPVLRVVDMRVEAEKEGRVNVLSRDLMEAIRARLDRSEQTILFLNRRGFSTSLVCMKCGHVDTCTQCSVSTTYHKKANRLCCHMCGEVTRLPMKCPACSDPSFRYAGIGTQRVEEVVNKIFPKARVQRMDADTTTKKGSHRRILGDFRSGKIDILLGTQMIAKGLHFPNVTLVGVISADLGLHIPDFRAGERTFQLLTQVAGRAGRGDVSGEVVVQTFTPFHTAIQAARRLDYEGFCDQEMEFRKELGYPPFSHLVCITLRGLIEEKVAFTCEVFTKALKEKLSKDVYAAGPSPAPLAKVKNMYRYQLMLRAVRTKMITTPLKEVLETFKWTDGVMYQIDVDAVSLL